MVRHTRSLSCESCEEKAKTLHPEMYTVWRRIKMKYPDAHISWAWRGPDDQNAFYHMGKSATPWPRSKHNTMKDGVPCSDAFDLFRLMPNGTAGFEMAYFRGVYGFCQEQGFRVEWGGNFRMKDGPHFQRIEPVPEPPGTVA